MISVEQKHLELVAEIRRISEEHGIPISSLSRRQFRQLSPIGTFRYANHGGAWGRAKRAALGTDVDAALETPPVEPIPPDMTLKGVSTMSDAEGNIRAQWTLARAVTPSYEEILQKILEELPSKIPIREGSIPDPAVEADDLLAVYPVADPHLGMLAWSEETLDHDYDISIAGSLLRGAMNELTMNAPRAGSALVANLGDFFHSDSDENRTKRSGHALDTDSRWAKILRVGLDAMIDMVDSCLRSHSHVRIVNEIGNHDDQTAYVLSVALDRHYSEEPRVDVDMSPAHFHYHLFGKVLIGITHGDAKLKPEDLESIMACDRADDWSSTDYRVWLTGHIHHALKKATRNCICESFSTLAPKDAWHARSGYRGSRDMSRIVYHRDHGEISRSMVSASYLQSRINRGKI